MKARRGSRTKPKAKDSGPRRIIREIDKRFARAEGEAPGSVRARVPEGGSSGEPARPPRERRRRQVDPPLAAAGPKLERLQKFMARRGMDSRRKCEELILEGRVKVGGVTVTELGFKVDPGSDAVSVDGKALPSEVPRYYIMLNKPRGYVTTCMQGNAAGLVVELIPKQAIEAGAVPAGRLDKMAEGLLLFSNDGEMIHRLTHPKYSVWKTYRVRVKGKLTGGALKRLEKGVDIGDGVTAPAQVKVIKAAEGYSVMELAIHEGRNRQVRRMCKAVGHAVLELCRSRIGPIKMGKLKPGECRELSAKEVEKLKKAVGMER